MANKTSIVNSALIKNGQATVTNIDTDESSRSDTIKEIYDLVLDQVLSETTWNFATKRRTLASASVKVPWTDDGMTTAFLYPSDALRIWMPNDVDLVWRVEMIDGKKYILTNTTNNLSIKYVYRNSNESQFPAYFADALAAKLSAELTYAFDQSNSQYQQRLEIYLNFYLPKAISMNSQEGTPIQPVADHFLMAKYGGRRSARRGF